MERRFQVDLRGIVDLLSHHLYASPRVYIRELLQNAMDAITARGVGGRVQVETLPDGALRVHDNGIGMTEEEALAGFVAAAEAALTDVDCVPVVRQFEPVTVPALYVMSRPARTQDAVRRGIEGSDALWAEVLSARRPPSSAVDRRGGAQPVVPRVARQGVRP